MLLASSCLQRRSDRSIWIDRRLVAVATVVLSLSFPVGAELAVRASAQPQAPGPCRLSFMFKVARTPAAQASRRLWSDWFVSRTVARLNARLTLPVT